MRSPIFYSLFTTLVLLSAYSLEHHHEDGTTCTHDHIDHPEPEFLDIEESFQISEEKEGRNLAGTTYYNIRMYAYYDTLNSAPSDYKTYFQKQLGPAVISYFQGALKVKYPVNGSLTVPSSQKTLCSIPTPAILRTGVKADYFIMFDSTEDTKSNWVAESYACFLATGSKRPLIAKSLLNRNLLKNPGNDILLHEKNIYLMLHEMTHTLGFSSSLYKYFLDANGKVRTGHILTKSTLLGNATVLNLPTLTSKIRTFFGCSTIAGAYMENTGSSATAGSHLERRMFPYEAMSSGLIYQQSFSAFTLALLEDSGWYVPNYAYADPYWFGQGQGCGFLTEACATANTKYDDFCTGSPRGCTVQGRGGGFCQNDTRSDGCRFFRPSISYDCENPDAVGFARLPELQSFGRDAGSKCFSGNLHTFTTSIQTSFCFKYKCSGSGSTTKLEVNVGTNTVICSKAGNVGVSGYKGTITCPDPLSFCSTVGKPTCPRNCMGRGSCVSGKCVCKTGFKGKDCGLAA